MKFWPVAMGVGMAAGAVAAMMLPKQSKARQLVSQAADKVETAVGQVASKVADEVSN